MCFNGKVKEFSRILKLNFSRHSKRRMKLYDIPESTISDVLKGTKFSAGRHEIVKRISNFELPLKLVIDVKDGVITIITVYPLKKGIDNERIL